MATNACLKTKNQLRKSETLRGFFLLEIDFNLNKGVFTSQFWYNG